MISPPPPSPATFLFPYYCLLLIPFNFIPVPLRNSEMASSNFLKPPLHEAYPCPLQHCQTNSLVCEIKNRIETRNTVLYTGNMHVFMERNPANTILN